MTAAQFEDLRTDEAAEVLAWRFDALCRSGFDLDAAAVLAANVESRPAPGDRARRAWMPARARCADPDLTRPDVGIAAADSGVGTTRPSGPGVGRRVASR